MTSSLFSGPSCQEQPPVSEAAPPLQELRRPRSYSPLVGRLFALTVRQPAFYERPPALPPSTERAKHGAPEAPYPFPPDISLVPSSHPLSRCRKVRRSRPGTA